MKKSRKIRIGLIMALLSVLCLAVLCACGKDDGKTSDGVPSVVILQAGEGGAFGGKEQLALEAEAGESIATVVSSTVPEAKDGYTFEGWYLGDEKLSSQTVPETGAVLTARYTVPFTVSVYLQDLDGSYRGAETVSLTGVLGWPYEYIAEKAHYTVDEAHGQRASTTSLAKDDELFVYLARETYFVIFTNELSDGSEESVSYELPYGAALTFKEEFVAEDGRRFSGWAPVTGEAYEAGETLTVEDNAVLHAVWDEAYFDRMGGG